MATTMSPASGYLDKLETSVQERSFVRDTDGYRSNVRRAETLNVMATEAEQQYRASKMERCADMLWVVRRHGEYSLAVNRCRIRHCPECERIVARRHSRIIGERLAEYKYPVMLTLTTRPQDASLGDAIKQLLHWFNRLRTRALWKQQVRRGIYVVEITRDPKRRWFHVHLHAIMDCAYVPRDWLAEQWQQITGSPGVHITRAEPKVAKYLASYVKKSRKLKLEPWEEWPVAEELHGRRLIGTFGQEPGINILPDDYVSHAPELSIPLSTIFSAAKTGDQQAAFIIETLAAKYPWLFDPGESP